VVQKGWSSLRLPGSWRGSSEGQLPESVQTSVLGPVLYNRIINYLKRITFTADNLQVIISIVKRKVDSEELDESS